MSTRFGRSVTGRSLEPSAVLGFPFVLGAPSRDASFLSTTGNVGLCRKSVQRLGRLQASVPVQKNCQGQYRTRVRRSSMSRSFDINLQNHKPRSLHRSTLAQERAFTIGIGGPVGSGLLGASVTFDEATGLHHHCCRSRTMLQEVSWSEVRDLNVPAFSAKMV